MRRKALSSGQPGPKLEKAYGDGAREGFACSMSLWPGCGGIAKDKERGEEGLVGKGSHFVSERRIDCEE